MRLRAIFVALLLSTPLYAADPAKVAALVRESDLDAPLAEALRAPDALTRATAARVAMVRNVTSTLPRLRELVPSETDDSAWSEEVAALVLLGEESDVDTAVASAAKRPPAADGIVADAAARRGGASAINLYLTKLRNLRETPGYFERALWGHPDLIPQTADRLLLLKDERGWRSLLTTLYHGAIALPAEATKRGLASDSEEIRTRTAWYLVRGFVNGPDAMKPEIRELLLAERSEASSDREDFARELLRRILGSKPVEKDRWIQWLDTKEADELLPNEAIVFTYFTDAEFKTRESRCKEMPVSCPVSPKRGGRTIPSQLVRQSPFTLPTPLPNGLSAVLEKQARSCGWIGVATATIDRAGRVQSIDLKNVGTECRQLLETITRMSLATNGDLSSPMTTSDILLARAKKAPLCLDAQPLDSATPRQVGGEITAPLVKHRVEPRFPASARAAMGEGSNVIVILQCVITRDGCVRSITLLTQSPFPELNAAALLAISQWTFAPGRLGGKPVDAIFNLTVNFKVS